MLPCDCFKVLSFREERSEYVGRKAETSRRLSWQICSFYGFQYPDELVMEFHMSVIMSSGD